MAGITADVESAFTIIENIYEEGVESRILAERAYEAASEDINRERAIDGWVNHLNIWKNSQWTPKDEDESTEVPRSGHDNQSGRFKSAKTLAGRGIYGNPVTVRGRAGTSFGKVDLEIATLKRDESSAEKKSGTIGEQFWNGVIAALKAGNGDTVEEVLSEKDAEALQRVTGYRV